MLQVTLLTLCVKFKKDNKPNFLVTNLGLSLHVGLTNHNYRLNNLGTQSCTSHSMSVDKALGSFGTYVCDQERKKIVVTNNGYTVQPSTSTPLALFSMRMHMGKLSKVFKFVNYGT